MQIHDLHWHTIVFTFKIYHGETFETADIKVRESLRHFPLMIHDFNILDKRPVNGLVQLTVDVGIKPAYTLSHALSKFHCVSHLSDNTVVEKEKIA